MVFDLAPAGNFTWAEDKGTLYLELSRLAYVTREEDDLHILRLVCTGMTDHEIGDRVGRAAADVTLTVQRLCQGTGCETRAELVIAAVLGSLA